MGVAHVAIQHSEPSSEVGEIRTQAHGVLELPHGLERNFKAVLQGGLAKLDLVTRQEFDIQAAVLRRSRERLEELEKRIAALEKPPPRN